MLEYAPRSTELLSYDEAVLYCMFCNHDGHRDWRMPTEAEWSKHIYLLGWCECTHERTWLDYVMPVRETTWIQYISHTIKQKCVSICNMFD